MATILITGASRGIGAALARQLASHHRLILNCRQTTPHIQTLLQEVQQTSPQSIITTCDVTQEAAVLALTKQLDALSLDTIIHTVGDLGPYQRWQALSTNDIQATLTSNLWSAVLLMKHLLPLVERNPAPVKRVILFACAEADYSLARRFTIPYYIAKQGIVTLVKSLAVEYAAAHITINAIAPGMVENSQVQLSTPMGRPAGYQDINHAIEFLLQPSSSYISGTVLPVTGGWTSTI